jgi:hypothetical protein
MKSKRFATALLISIFFAVLVSFIYLSTAYLSNSKSSSHYSIKAPALSQPLVQQSSTTPSNSYHLWINAVLHNTICSDQPFVCIRCQCLSNGISHMHGARTGNALLRMVGSLQFNCQFYLSLNKQQQHGFS